MTPLEESQQAVIAAVDDDPRLADGLPWKGRAAASEALTRA
jgi:hypothetical protein